MSKKIAIDTNIAIGILNGHENVIVYLSNFDQIFIPVTVNGELLFGAHNSTKTEDNLSKFRQFISQCLPMPVTEAVAESYALIRIGLKKRGTPIPENDIWIAAICMANNIPLLTKDKHFAHIEGLVIFNP